MILTNENYVSEAEKAINDLLQLKDKSGKPIKPLTTSKIRGLLAMTSEIYNEVILQSNETLTQEQIGKIQYLKIRTVYEAGREPTVRNFVKTANIIEHIDGINKSRSRFILFSRYMEALVAYRKYLGGKDE